MALTINDTSPVEKYTATSGQTSFAVPFEFFSNTDLVVTVNGTVITYAASPSDQTEYSVTGAGVEGGGSITLGAPGATLNDVVVIYRDIPVTRSADYPETGPFNVASLNNEQAKQTAVLQQFERDVARTFQVAMGSNPLDLIADGEVVVRSGTTFIGEDVTTIGTAAAAAASASASAAATSETNAATSETNADASATAAASSASAADASATAADASATAAATSETNADNSATAAAASAVTASEQVWTYAGAWATATAYTTAPASVVTQDGNSYICTEAHTSGSFATDLAASKWGLLVEAGADGGGAGTVTSVDFDGGTTGLTATGTPITSSGTILLDGTLAVGHGGTGQTSLTGLAVTGVNEGTGTISDGASVVLDPDNGGIQQWTLGATRTATCAAGWANGQSLTLMVDDGTAFSLTITGVSWVGGSAPTLATSGWNVITLWKIGGTVYGMYAGATA